MTNNISKIQFPKFAWHNLTANGEAEIRYLRDHFQFDPGHLTDCATPPSRPKIEFMDNYVFVALLFPVYNRQSGLIGPREIDVFLQKDHLVTVHTNEVAALKNWPRPARERSTSPLPLFLALLEEMLLSLYPMLNHVAWDIDNLESQLFTGRERDLIHKILVTKKNIVDIRKSMQGYRHILTQMARHYRRYFGALKLDEIFTELENRIRDIWDQLENHKSTMDAVQQSNESLISFGLSHIMKTLTILSVIIFPLTLLATLFAMDAKGGMPFVDSPYGFWQVIFLMLVLAGSMLYYFKKHRWL